MNDLGLTLAWLAVQVTLVLFPALALHALATRRGPASGAWVASLSLGLVVVLSASAFIPRVGREDKAPAGGVAPVEPAALGTATVAGPGSTGRTIGPESGSPPDGRGITLARLRRAWARLGRGAAAPAARCRPWGGVLAAVGLTGMGVGLLRLLIGLWAVGHCRRRGRGVVDPEMLDLLDELRASMGCRPRVELREVADLATPATAGWRRPVLLLPGDWRTWDAHERRAVFAHELAHVIRGDYAAGLLARLALVLNFYHPIVRRMAGRLQLQQEQAADALGARFAGGRASYLVALSRLALRQDGRSPSWPARAFLPARGTLIRRIAMLRDETRTGNFDRPWSGARRLLTACGLLGLTIGVATIRGPARGAEDAPPATVPAPAKAGTPAPHAVEAPFEPFYVSDTMNGVFTMNGVLAFRPAAAFRRTGMGRLAPLCDEALIMCLSELSAACKVDMSRPVRRTLRSQDIEWVISGVGLGRSKQKDDEGRPLHTMVFTGLTVRTVAPFDWLAFLRQWNFDFEEVREGGRVYYKVAGPLRPGLGLNPCVYLPDDRTAVFDEEAEIQKFVRRDFPAPPAYLRGPDWERVSRGLLAVAMNNQDGAFAKTYDLGRPDDAAILSLFKGVDRWVLGVDDADAIVLHADAACDGRDASEAIGRAIDSLRKLGLAAIDRAPLVTPDGVDHGGNIRMVKALLTNLRVEPTDRSVDVRAEGFGTLADFAAIVEAEDREARARGQERLEKSKVSKR